MNEKNILIWLKALEKLIESDEKIKNSLNKIFKKEGIPATNENIVSFIKDLFEADETTRKKYANMIEKISEILFGSMMLSSQYWPSETLTEILSNPAQLEKEIQNIEKYFNPHYKDNHRHYSVAVILGYIARELKK